MPELISYLEATGDSHPDGPDVWISTIGLDASDVLPGMPKPYLQEVLDGCALYALGVPLDWQILAFKEIFRNCGKVLKCPCIIDLKSEQVFRWVVMSTPEEAAAVMRDINGLKLAGETVRFCRALPPGARFVFSEEYPLQEFLNWELKPPSMTSQWIGCDDPVQPSLPQQPVSVVLQPPTPANVHTHPAMSGQDKQQPPAVLRPTNLPVQSTPFTVGNLDDDFVPQAVSWANIVSARGGPRSVDLKTPSKLAGSASRLRTVGRIAAVTRTKTAEPLAKQMRVVFLLNIPNHVSLTNISDAIKEGSLVSNCQ
jgi:hypothetical protein